MAHLKAQQTRSSAQERFADRARSFYERYQFIGFPDKPNKLFLTMTAIAKMLNK